MGAEEAHEAHATGQLDGLHRDPDRFLEAARQIEDPVPVGIGAADVVEDP
jgi:hypothetical protein